MGVKFLRMALPVLLGLLLSGQVRPQPAPLQDRMRTWKMAHRHPDPAFLNPLIFFAPTDTKERVWKGKEERWGSLWYPGRNTWRPDASAQVDELRAQLMDQARLEGWK